MVVQVVIKVPWYGAFYQVAHLFLHDKLLTDEPILTHGHFEFLHISLISEMSVLSLSDMCYTDTCSPAFVLHEEFIL